LVGKTYARNEKVKVRSKDGKVSEVKFKKVEAAIKNGDCSIID
jgi:hypothetical protein